MNENTKFDMNTEVSLFSNSNSTKQKAITIDDLIDGLRTDEIWYDITTRHRENPDANIKTNEAPGFTLSVCCVDRNRKTPFRQKVISYTGLMQIDIDKIPEDSFHATKEILCKEPFMLCVFESISGNGLKGFARYKPPSINDSEDIAKAKHKQSLENFKNYFTENHNIKIDTSQSSIFSLCFISNDSNLYVNPEATIFEPKNIVIDDIKPVAETHALNHNLEHIVDVNKTINIAETHTETRKAKEPTEDEIKRYLENSFKTELKQVETAPHGQKNTIRCIKVARTVGGNVPIGYMEYNTTLQRLIDSALKNTNNPQKTIYDITNSFHKGMTEPHDKEKIKQKYMEYLAKNNRKNGISKNHTNHTGNQIDKSEAMQTDIDLPFCFWIEKPQSKNNTQLVILRDKLHSYLDSNGFAIYYLTEAPEANTNYMQITNNIAKLIRIKDISNFIVDEIRALKHDYISDNYTKDDLIELFKRQQTSLITDSELCFLKKYTLNNKEFLRDDETNSYFPFLNGVCKVNASGIELIEYTSIDKIIWHDKILKRNLDIRIKKDDINNIYDYLSEFQQENKHNELVKLFFLNTCNYAKTSNETLDLNHTQFISQILAIGYLLHNHNSYSNSRLIGFLERTNLNDETGGNGKSLICKGLSMLRKLNTMNGRELAHENQFMFSEIKHDDDIVVLDDLPTKFNIDILYNKITDDFAFERKNKNKETIPFKLKPKMVYTKNTPVEIKTNADKRRLLNIEISSFYSRTKIYPGTNTTTQNIHKQFFNDSWYESDNENVQNATNFYLACLVYYFQRNCQLIESAPSETMKIRQLEMKLPEIEFWFQENIEYNIARVKRELYDSYIETTKQRYITMNKFSSGLIEYCKLKKIECKETKQSQRMITFFESEKTKQEYEKENPLNEEPF